MMWLSQKMVLRTLLQLDLSLCRQQSFLLLACLRNKDKVSSYRGIIVLTVKHTTHSVLCPSRGRQSSEIKLFLLRRRRERGLRVSVLCSCAPPTWFPSGCVSLSSYFSFTSVQTSKASISNCMKLESHNAIEDFSAFVLMELLYLRKRSVSERGSRGTLAVFSSTLCCKASNP